jgi:hypothetical protein
MIEQINNVAEGWWDWMWPMLWQVSALIVLIGAVDILLRKRVWPQVRYALWMLVLVKLILPPTFTLSTSLVWQLRPWGERAIRVGLRCHGQKKKGTAKFLGCCASTVRRNS